MKTLNEIKINNKVMAGSQNSSMMN